MGCGKSKHAVETATTVIKSTKSDGGKETRTTKTVTEKGDALVEQHEVETKSLVVEDTKKETVTTKIDPNGVANIANVAPTLGENVGTGAQVVKEDESTKDSNPSNANDANVGLTLDQNVGKVAEVVKENENVKDSHSTDTNDAKSDNVIPTQSKDDVRVTEVVTKDQENKESNLVTDKEAKTDNVTAKRLEEIKMSNIPKDNVKNEFMTPTLSEDVVDPMTKVFKDDVMVKDLKKENIQSAIPDDEESANSINDSSNPIDDDSPKAEEQEVVSPTVDVTDVETKIETSPAAISQQAKAANEGSRLSSIRAVAKREKEANIALSHRMPIIIMIAILIIRIKQMWGRNHRHNTTDEMKF
ncbi:hypothetical protein Tco_1030578 [Tanacetum coccineum]|uniref:Uncharacterized protein n=1 Tax=Tanacetum coccineum TaxID=301880 RepID=A0ABQ5G8G8_9ASTR